MATIDYPYSLPGIAPSIYIPKNLDGSSLQPSLQKLPGKMALDVIKVMSDKGIRNKGHIINKICNKDSFNY